MLATRMLSELSADTVALSSRSLRTAPVRAKAHYRPESYTVGGGDGSAPKSSGLAEARPV
jgi:hypothetical protein